MNDTRDSIISLLMRSSAKTAAAAPYALRRTSTIQTLFDGLRACGADRREAAIRADVVGVLPAALALLAAGTFDGDAEIARGGVVQFHLRNDEEPGKLAGILFEEREEVAVRGEADAGLERRADELLIARGLQAPEHIAPHFHQTVPIRSAFPRGIVQPG